MSSKTNQSNIYNQYNFSQGGFVYLKKTIYWLLHYWICSKRFSIECKKNKVFDRVICHWNAHFQYISMKLKLIFPLNLTLQIVQLPFQNNVFFSHHVSSIAWFIQRLTLNKVFLQSFNDTRLRVSHNCQNYEGCKFNIKLILMHVMKQICKNDEKY